MIYLRDDPSITVALSKMSPLTKTRSRRQAGQTMRANSQTLASGQKFGLRPNMQNVKKR